MDGVSVASSIAGLVTLALQVSGTIAVYVTAIRDRDKNTAELQSELELLGEVLSQLKDFLKSEKAKGRTFDEACVLRRAIRDCNVRIERIGDKVKPFEGGKMKRMLDKIKWPFEQREIVQHVENLRRFVQTFQFAVTIEGCTILSKTHEQAIESSKEMMAITEKLTAMSMLTEEDARVKSAQLEKMMALIPMLEETATEVIEIGHGVRMMEENERRRRDTEILDWLCPISALHKHRDVQAKRAPDTGVWLLQHGIFRDWIAGKLGQQELLCTGGPGVGKTVLTSIVVDHLRQTQQRQEAGVAYFYCDYSEHGQTLSHFVSVLLRQLCVVSDWVPSVVVEFFAKTKHEVKDQTWLNDLKDVLLRVVSTFVRCFLVIDALDEAPVGPRKQFLDIIHGLKIRAPSSVTIRVFATSRPLTGLEHIDFFRWEIQASKSDLLRFLTRAIDEHPDSEYIMDAELKQDVTNGLSETAKGMFLLPALQIKDILNQVTKAQVRKALRNLSKTLPEVFASSIERIKSLPSGRRSLAAKSLLWLSHANRAMSVDALRHALAIDVEEECLDLDPESIPETRAILDSCCGLVEVDRESSTIRFVHFSLEEFLRSSVKHEMFAVGDGDRQLAITCLKYMMLRSLRDLPFKNRANFTKATVDLPLLSYAATEWGHHAQNVSLEDIRDLAVAFLTSSLHLLVVARVRDSQERDFRKWKERMYAWAFSGGAGVSLTASFGLSELTELLISKHKQSVTSRNIYGSTPLHEAALRGHVKTAQILMAHSADILDQNKGKSTPLYMAVAFNQLPMVEELLRHGHAQLEIRGRDGWTPLHKAADMGSESLTTALLQAGATVAAHDDRMMTPLHLAARKGYLEVVRLLVLASAPVHVKAHDRLAPLDYAATGGFTEVVKFLRANGGSVTHKSPDKWTPLHRAARSGHHSTVRLILESDVDVLQADNKGSIPLHLAARSGDLETVAALLDGRPHIRREQLFHQDHKGSTPRIVAFYTGNYPIHKFLREREREFIPFSPTLENRLTAAIEEGSISKVHRLLSTKAQRIDGTDEDGQPPLHVAIQEQRADIAAILLDHGASINSVGYHGWRPLHIAAALGHLSLLDFCLQQGADVHAQSSTRQTALHKACSSRSPTSLAVIRRLLEAGSDPRATNERGMTCLHVAAHQNNTEAVRLLINEQNVDLFAVDRFGDTPASWAARGGHLELLSILRAEEKKARRSLTSSSMSTLSNVSTNSIVPAILIDDLSEDPEPESSGVAMSRTQSTQIP